MVRGIVAGLALACCACASTPPTTLQVHATLEQGVEWLRQMSVRDTYERGFYYVEATGSWYRTMGYSLLDIASDEEGIYQGLTLQGSHDEQALATLVRRYPHASQYHFHPLSAALTDTLYRARSVGATSEQDIERILADDLVMLALPGPRDFSMQVFADELGVETIDLRVVSFLGETRFALTDAGMALYKQDYPVFESEMVTHLFPRLVQAKGRIGEADLEMIEKQMKAALSDLDTGDLILRVQDIVSKPNEFYTVSFTPFPDARLPTDTEPIVRDDARFPVLLNAAR